MPRLNGKFVSQAAYDAAQAAQEDNTMSEYVEETADEAAEVFEEAEGSRKRGPRPLTVYKTAVNKRTAAEVKARKARNKLAKFDNGRDDLIQAVEDAEAEYELAQSEVDEAAEGL